jgi:nucleolar GTP-binding protein
MNFQGLSKVENAQAYIDIAFRQSNRAIEDKRKQLKGKKLNRIQKSRIMEIEKINAVKSILAGNLDAITNAYPQTAQLPLFYLELIKATTDYYMLKKSLGAVSWASKRIKDLCDKYSRQIRQCKDFDAIIRYRNEAYGRMASIVKQIQENLKYLEFARKTMKNYPAIKTGIPTVVIAGYPNVGKSTLLKALTGANVEIASYPFTTKQIMLGYIEKRLQIIDTPGLLDRPIEKRNPIEKHAILALKYLAEKIIFILDPSEACGFPIKDQIKLMNEIKKTFPAETIVVINKIDCAAPDQMESVKNLKALHISAEKGDGIEELKKIIDKHARLTQTPS